MAEAQLERADSERGSVAEGEHTLPRVPTEALLKKNNADAFEEEAAVGRLSVHTGSVSPGKRPRRSPTAPQFMSFGGSEDAMDELGTGHSGKRNKLARKAQSAYPTSNGIARRRRSFSGRSPRTDSRTRHRRRRSASRLSPRSPGRSPSFRRRRSSGVLKQAASVRALQHADTLGTRLIAETKAAIRCAIPVGTHVWTVDRFGQIGIRDRLSAKLKEDMPVEQPNINIASLVVSSPSEVWAGCDNGHVLVFDTNTRKLLRRMKRQAGCIKAMLAAATIVLMSPDEQRRHAAMPLTRSHIRRVSLAHLHDSDALSQASSSDVAEPEVLLTGGSTSATADNSGEEGGDTGVDQVCLLNRVWTASDDFTIAAYNSLTGEFAQQYTGHANGVRCLGILGTKLFSGSDDGTIRVWNVSSIDEGACVAVLPDHKAPVCSIAVVSPDLGHKDPRRMGEWSTQLVSADETGVVRLWNAYSLEPQRVLAGFQGTVGSLLQMGAGELWCGEESGRISTINSTSGFSRTAQVGEHSRFVSGMATVRCLESRTTWSHSLGDEMIKVWRQTVKQTTSGGVLEGLVEDLAMRLQATEQALNNERQRAAQNKETTAALKQQVRELLDSLKARDRALEEQKKAVEDKTRELNELTSATSTNTSVASLLRATVEQRDQEMHVMKQELTQLRNVHGAQSYDGSSKEKENRELREQVDHLRRGLASQKNEVAKILSALAATDSPVAKAEHDRVKEQLRVTSNTLVDREERIEALTDRLSELNVFHMDRLARHLRDVRNLVTKADAVVDTFAPQVVQSKSDRATVKRLLTDVSASLHAIRGRLDQAMNSTMTARVNLSVGVPLDSKAHHHINPDGVSLMAVGLADRAGHDATGLVPLRRRSPSGTAAGGGVLGSLASTLSSTKGGRRHPHHRGHSRSRSRPRSRSSRRRLPAYSSASTSLLPPASHGGTFSSPIRQPPSHGKYRRRPRTSGAH